MQMLVVIHASEMERSVAFYETIGFQRDEPGAVDAWWNVFSLGDARLALHHDGGDALPPVSSRMLLNLELPPDGALEHTLETCMAHGIPLGAGIDDVGFGRFFWVTDPDGLPVQFNERTSA